MKINIEDVTLVVVDYLNPELSVSNFCILKNFVILRNQCNLRIPSLKTQVL